MNKSLSRNFRIKKKKKNRENSWKLGYDCLSFSKRSEKTPSIIYYRCVQCAIILWFHNHGNCWNFHKKRIHEN